LGRWSYANAAVVDIVWLLDRIGDAAFANLMTDLNAKASIY